MAAPGRLLPKELTRVQDGTYGFLSVKTARAWKRARAKLPKGAHGATPAGLYRPADVQNAMADAGAHGPAAARVRWGLDANSRVSIARHPGGSHELGTAIDVGGIPITPAVIATMRKYGFTRQFGSADPRHFLHDGKTATGVLPSTKVYYLVDQGDTLSAIAPRYKTTWQKIASLNGLKSPYTIYPGQRLRVK